MFKPGDIVKVKNKGHVYTTYIKMAVILKADFDPDDHRGYIRKKDTKWKWANSPSCKDIYKIVRTHKRSMEIFCLIESIETNDQFIIGYAALTLYDYPNLILEKELFEI